MKKPPHQNGFSLPKEPNDTPFSTWKIYQQFSNQLSLLYQERPNGITYKVQYIHKFFYKFPSWISSAEKFLLLYSSPDCLEKTSQKIRYYRHKNSMYAKDVASYLGITPKVYSHYEQLKYEYCPIPLLEKLSTLYQIPITNLLDDYHLFLYQGQGTAVRQYRKSLHLTQQEMATALGLTKSTVRLWENEFHRMTRTTYELLFIQKTLE